MTRYRYQNPTTGLIGDQLLENLNGSNMLTIDFGVDAGMQLEDQSYPDKRLEGLMGDKAVVNATLDVFVDPQQDNAYYTHMLDNVGYADSQINTMRHAFSRPHCFDYCAHTVNEHIIQTTVENRPLAAERNGTSIIPNQSALGVTEQLDALHAIVSSLDDTFYGDWGIRGVGDVTTGDYPVIPNFPALSTRERDIWKARRKDLDRIVLAHLGFDADAGNVTIVASTNLDTPEALLMMSKLGDGLMMYAGVMDGAGEKDIYICSMPDTVAPFYVGFETVGTTATADTSTATSAFRALVSNKAVDYPALLNGTGVYPLAGMRQKLTMGAVVPAATGASIVAECAIHANVSSISYNACTGDYVGYGYLSVGLVKRANGYVQTKVGAAPLPIGYGNDINVMTAATVPIAKYEVAPGAAATTLGALTLVFNPVDRMRGLKDADGYTLITTDVSYAFVVAAADGNELGSLHIPWPDYMRIIAPRAVDRIGIITPGLVTNNSIGPVLLIECGQTERLQIEVALTSVDDYLSSNMTGDVEGDAAISRNRATLAPYLTDKFRLTHLNTPVMMLTECVKYLIMNQKMIREGISPTLYEQVMAKGITYKAAQNRIDSLSPQSTFVTKVGLVPSYSAKVPLELVDYNTRTWMIARLVTVVETVDVEQWYLVEYDDQYGATRVAVTRETAMRAYLIGYAIAAGTGGAEYSDLVTAVASLPEQLDDLELFVDSYSGVVGGDWKTFDPSAFMVKGFLRPDLFEASTDAYRRLLLVTKGVDQSTLEDFILAQVSILALIEGADAY